MSDSRRVSEEQIRHLEMIQNCISRLSQNSFALKGWTVTLLAAFFAIAGSSLTQVHLLIASTVIISFWKLDTYFLGRERDFRDLYNRVRVASQSDWRKMRFEMRPFSRSDESAVAFSSTLLWLYGPLLAIALATCGIIHWHLV